jgi:hypothetical protein
MFKKAILPVWFLLFGCAGFAQDPAGTPRPPVRTPQDSVRISRIPVRTKQDTGRTKPDAVRTSRDSVRTSNDIYVARAEIINGDTVWVADLDEIYIFPERTFENLRQQRRYNRLIMNVKKAYPWAKIAGQLMVEVNNQLLTLPTAREQDEYLKKIEKDLLDNYTEDMKKLTVTQGKILIKLVYRETGETSYNIVELYRGRFSAFFWQALARLFGSNLKMGYDPLGEDRLIEEIVVQIEHGQL